MNLNLKVSEPQQKNNIVVFFLSSDEKKGDNYLSLSEGLEKNLVTVEKKIPSLILKNLTFQK